MIIFASAMALASIGSAVYSGVQQSQAADAAAKTAKRQAAWTEMQNKAEADRQASHDKQLLSFQRARLAASGRDPAGESPLLILGETAAKSNVDYRSILLGGEFASDNLMARSSAYKSQGQAALVGGALQGASTAASSAFQARQMNSYTNGRGVNAPAGGQYDW